VSNKNPEIDYSTLTDALKFFFEQMVKGMYICIPGIIDSYEATTKRATVHPAINLKQTDGTTVQQSGIANVPVVWPGGGGFSLLSPLPSGSPVVICFSQRGITAFKEVFEETDPDGNLFAKEDCFILPGFGALSVTPATEDGITLQSEDGVDHVFIEDGLIKINTDGNVEIQGNADTAIAFTDMKTAFDTLVSEVNAFVSVYNSHTHGGAVGAPAATATPAAADMSGAEVSNVKLP